MLLPRYCYWYNYSFFVAAFCFVYAWETEIGKKTEKNVAAVSHSSRHSTLHLLHLPKLLQS